MKINTIIPILMCTWMAQACAWDEGPFVPKKAKPGPDTNGVNIPEPTLLADTVAFRAQIVPIFTANCVQGCHNPHHEFLDLRPPVAHEQLLTEGAKAPYVNPTLPKESILYKHMVGIYTPMPKDLEKLPQAQIDLIYTWIAQGALDN
ncbi:MAG: hypothetical protein HYZ16_06835 [Bacteroidetes bacterium]|jgi:hypothetical protein|nr:hypothetical protein [Bacteroidota bacterium]